MSIEQWFADNETALTAMTTLDVVKAFHQYMREVTEVHITVLPPVPFAELLPRYEEIGRVDIDGGVVLDPKVYGLSAPLYLFRKCA